ncbi:twin-arginine translocation signal domain-containing protein [Halorhabdus salina]|uniref:twin-arginine translocation signal domain-containing protein n=1 Tax=Halorhabdus salina TaxID=2750670 RepID=UPI0015EED874|nr:twin-arginine translocation signal domain-containing protein [Halorhabdus salina]
MERRRFLKTAGALGAIGLTAGCMNSGAETDQPGEKDTDEPTDTDSGTPTDHATSTEPDSTDTTEDRRTTTDDGQLGDSTTTEPDTSSSVGWASGGRMDGVAFEFSSGPPECGKGTDETDIEFDTDAGEILVNGIISGSDLCQRAQLADITHDSEESAVSIAIESVDREDCDVGAQCIADIAYEARLTFEEELPESASVSHDGQGLASAAHGSTSAGPPAETTTE